MAISLKGLSWQIIFNTNELLVFYGFTLSFFPNFAFFSLPFHFILAFEKQIEKAPERVLQTAVKGMLPKGPLGRTMLKKLKVYAGGEHPHAAQQPQALEL